MTDRVRITIRLDLKIEQALRLEARRAGRRFQEHIRAKLAQPTQSVMDRLARVERKVMFVALAQQKLLGLNWAGIWTRLWRRSTTPTTLLGKAGCLLRKTIEGFWGWKRQLICTR